ncbi:MAG: T9SS type A sorting domain-containing protein [Bacteroidales bacterium]|jgi:hypothetical protein|nr:T9SS type A sorting domain-containing protein [Bacteroidales bacterium]
MKKNLFFYLGVVLVLVTSIISLQAAPGDTTVVQTFTFENGRQCHKGKFLFPDGSVQYEKVLMLYSLKCAPGYNPSCGEWDYIFYTEIYEPVGINGVGDTIFDVWKMASYVSPYGNNLSLGTDGWTWVYDVSDFVNLLKDSVIIRDCNGQELMDIKFLFIEGTPPRDVIDIKKIYDNSYSLSSFDQHVKDTTVVLNSNAQQVKLRTMVSGHDFDNPDNCAEFCDNNHTLKVNGNSIKTWNIIQECANNPLFPQGGTWIYDRAAWCPGMPVTVNEFELSNYIANHTVNFDYDVQFSTWGFYRTALYLVSYGNINHANDAAIEYVITPSDNKLFSRINPSCGHPAIVIKNLGSNNLQSATFKYAINNFQEYTYQWQGNIPFMAIDTVYLPIPDWNVMSEPTGLFHVELTSPNGVDDPTPYNNRASSSFELPKVFPNHNYQIQFKTNNDYLETTWKIMDMDGKIICQNDSILTPNARFDKDIYLENGSYKMYVYDEGNDGLSFWAHNPPYGTGTSGFIRMFALNENGQIQSLVKSFPADFGKFTQVEFAVGEFALLIAQPTLFENLTLFPNPVATTLNLNLTPLTGSKGSVSIFDVFGREVAHQEVLFGQLNAIHVHKLNNGVYFLTLYDQSKIVGQSKFVKIK